MVLQRIVSGGQTGADRAGLDFALESGIPCGGWCPLGRKAEDGPISEKYPLKETKSADYPERTRLNVADSDATIIFDAPSGKMSRGTKLTVDCCQRAKKLYLVLRNFPDVAADASLLRTFLQSDRIETLNIAGNRESGTPGMHSHVSAVLRAVLATNS